MSEQNYILGHVVNKDIFKRGSLELLNPAMGQSGGLIPDHLTRLQQNLVLRLFMKGE